MRQVSNPAQRVSGGGSFWSRRRGLVAALVSVLIHGLLVLWTVVTEKPDDPAEPAGAVAEAEDDRPIAVSLFDPTEGMPEGDVHAHEEDGDAPVSGTEEVGSERVHRQRPSLLSPDDDPDLPEIADATEPPDLPDVPADPGPDALEPEPVELPAPSGPSDDLVEDGEAVAESAPDSDGPGVGDDSIADSLADSGLPVPGPAGGEGDDSFDRDAAPFPSPPGSSAGGGLGTGDPGSARLFDPNVIGRSVSRWRANQPSREELMDAYGADDEDSPGAEQQRVSARLGRDIADANTMGEVRGGLLSSCNDGLDNNYDGWIDCGDPGCRAALPFCRNTVVLANLDRRDIPDDHPGGVSSEIVVRHPGSVRALSVRLQVKHTSPGDLAVVLEHVDTNRSVVLRRTNRSERQYVSAFYTRDFNGGPVSGRWRLTVRDLVAGGTGYIEQWHLVITG